MYKERPVVAEEDVDQFFRDAVYTRCSDVPLSRDGGWAAMNKKAWGLRRRAWMSFLKSQAKLRSSDRAIPEGKKTGKPAKDLNEFETDLMEVRTSQMPQTLKDIQNSYIVTTVHRSSSLTNLIWIKNKEPATATPALLKALKWFSEVLKFPVSKMVVASDAGFEFDSKVLAQHKVKHIVKKIGFSVEARNGVVRRQLFKILNLKRGGFEASLKQTQDVVNNLISKVHGKTPNEVAGLPEKEVLEKFNAKRQKSSRTRRPSMARLALASMMRAICPWSFSTPSG